MRCGGLNCHRSKAPTVLSVAIIRVSAHVDLSADAHPLQLVRSARREQVTHLLEEPQAILVQEFVSERVTGHARGCERPVVVAVPLAALRHRSGLRARVHELLELHRHVGLLREALCPIYTELLELPESSQVREHQAQLLASLAESAHEPDDHKEGRVGEHVVLCTQHHRDRKRDQERTRAAQREHEVKLAREAHLINRAQPLLDGLIKLSLETLPARRAMHEAVPGVLHVLVQIPPVEKLLDVEREDVADHLEENDDYRENEVDEQVTLADAEKER
mmetsp:Transcript_6237/g.25027  ORF Transcript_6237/g.25027 Transcript_6237/m.25027 type:complete len:277 (-) Transcript_6237:311-1141(-)